MRAGNASSAPIFSGKERDILRQIALGISHKEIAHKTFVSAHTVH